ncbi:hypothetical protein GLOIN_2v1769286 [Rhizophagus irregularis DAOM 181602=DAOM 197198]|nr:hypothetical protein GLOIN_2v1769286 [Rhizophagus irregularis DAOM 181602=DAOM 197198]
MTFECSQEVADDYEKLLETDEDYNVIIYVGENENLKEIHAHSSILRIRSQYFRAAFSKEWHEKKDGKFIFRKPNVSPQLFDMILRFIYYPTQWNNEEITIMERTIHKFISLIRFCYISTENFVTKIYPFKEIFPKDLINTILLFYAQNKLNEDKRPPRQSKCNIDSVIINQSHIETFAKWIYRKEKFPEYIPYNFHLLYRASRDGNTPAAFHEKCDNKGATIVVVKVTDSKQIVGGYNPFYWDLNSREKHKSTYDSFIFSFNDPQSAKVSYSNGNQYSLCYYSGNNGPVFGGGNDLKFHKDTWYSNIDNYSSYPKIDIPTGSFRADDYEVFQVVKK